VAAGAPVTDTALARGADRPAARRRGSVRAAVRTGR
jgi:hypothetical protein